MIQNPIPPDLKNYLKKINHDLDRFDELMSQIEEHKDISSIEKELNNEH